MSEIVLDYRLAELPSSQHRAGLAGLVLMARWLGQQHPRPPGTLVVDRLGAEGATIHLDQQGVQALFDLTYAASSEEVERAQPLKNKQKQVVPPLREVERDVTDAKGKVKKKKFYVYSQVVPRGAFLVDHDPSAKGENGLWVKLWRDVVWSIFRGVPATRRPFEARAEKENIDDAAKAWRALRDPEGAVELPSTYFLGAQATTAENVPFQDKNRFLFLLHFWPYVAPIYVPQELNNDGERNFAGFALAIPDVSDLEAFCDELFGLLDARDTEVAGYRPRGAVIDVALEGGLDLLFRLRSRIAQREGDSRTRSLVVGVDVIHTEKQGNNVRVLSVGRVEPRAEMLDKYAQIQTTYSDPRFRQRRLLSLLADQPWHAGFDRLLSTVPYDQTFSKAWFRKDARLGFELEGGVQMSRDPDDEMAAKTLEMLIYRAVRVYLHGKVKSKHGLQWEAVKDDEKKKREFIEAREKAAREVFLAARSRTEAGDFIELFTSKICSVPQRMNEDDYRQLSTALADALASSDVTKLRTLTMLALAANA